MENKTNCLTSFCSPLARVRICVRIKCHHCPPLPHDCIVWLQNTGDASDNEIAMDDLSYAYENGTGNSNQLRNVKDFVTVGMSQGFYDGNIAPGVDDYEYDEN